MHADPVFPIIITIIIAILVLGTIAKKLKQPLVIAYLLVGVTMGPYGLGLITDTHLMARLGSIGVLLLLFFAGMEVSPKRFSSNWVIPLGGTLLQTLISVFFAILLGLWLDWTLPHMILIGFVITISSTAIVVKLLQDWNELNSKIGQHVLGILLTQDLAIIPMIIILGLLAGQSPTTYTFFLQIFGGLFIISLAVLIIIKDYIHLPLLNKLKQDHEMQIFAALAFFFGLATLTGMAKLSGALGAFVAGMLIASARETHWVSQSLSSFRVVFIALFFVSVGMLINIDFIIENWWQLFFIVLTVFILNTLINAGILRFLGEHWKNSIYGASLLAQIGEFSFVLVQVGLYTQIINFNDYQMTITVIALTLVVSPLWIALNKKLIRY